MELVEAITAFLYTFVRHDADVAKWDVRSAPPYKHLQQPFSVHNMYFMRKKCYPSSQQSNAGRPTCFMRISWLGGSSAIIVQELELCTILKC